MQTVRYNSKFIALIVSLAVIFLIYWKHKPITDQPPMTLLDETRTDESPKAHDSQADSHRSKLAVIVPFRDRFEELLEFVPHMHQYLTNKSIDHQIFVINQADKLRFNRAALINIGYLVSQSDCDYLAMHDVDLLPLHPKLDYSKPSNHIFHVAAPYLHPLYHYPKFVGGILILTHQHFKELNGLSNRYWGWGREDDEFNVRIEKANIEIKRPDQMLVKTGITDTFRHLHDKQRRPRDNRRYGNQKEAGRFADPSVGLNTVRYNLTEVYDIRVKDSPARVYNVELHCDKADTPWCEHPADPS